jgi:hypothetical protein
MSPGSKPILLAGKSPPARHHRPVIRVGGVGMDQVARAIFVDPVLRVVVPVGIGHGVEVIQVAEIFIEPVHRRQIFVQIAEMVLAELPGHIAERFQHGRERHRLRRNADVGARLAHGRQAGAQRDFAGDEIGPARGATRLGIVIGEPYAFGGDPVEVRRLARHDALVIGADIKPPDVVGHDEKNIRRPAGRLGLGFGLRLGHLNRRGGAQSRS